VGGADGQDPRLQGDRHRGGGQGGRRPRHRLRRAHRSPGNEQAPIDSLCECEHSNPDSLDARLFPSVMLAVAPAVPMDEASSLTGLLCSHSHGESIGALVCLANK